VPKLVETAHELIETAQRFREKLEFAKEKLGPQDFPWYPYDSFGYLRWFDSSWKGSIETLRNLAGSEPVLDVGCADGALSFFMESLGCEVDAIDNPPTNHNGMQGVRTLRAAMGSSVAIHSMDIDARFEPPREKYGLTLLLGILYHLKNPFYVLETLAGHTRFCLLGTRVARVTPKGAAIQNEPLAYLVDDQETNADATNFWIFSEEGLRRILHRSGWTVREFFTEGCKDGSDPVRGDRDERAFCLIESRLMEPPFPPILRKGWFEIEDNWRWTGREFSVSLPQDPFIVPNALELNFVLLDKVLAVTGPITVYATVNGRKLKPQSFSSPGEHVYSADLPKGALDGTPAHVEFSLDKAWTSKGGDDRELGLIVAFYTRSLSMTFAHQPIRFVQI
jgi:tRNA (mo5U34)-methyltransferase